MLSLDYVKEHIEEIERDFLDRRFTKRFLDFIPVEEWENFGYEYTGEGEREVLDWTEENIIDMLKKDVDFGIEKAENHRGISSSLMASVCGSWLDVLEDDSIDRDLYGWYGCDLFKAIDEKYNFGLVKEDTFDDEFYEEW